LVSLSIRRIEQAPSYLLIDNYRKQEQANDARNFLASAPYNHWRFETRNSSIAKNRR